MEKPIKKAKLSKAKLRKLRREFQGPRPSKSLVTRNKIRRFGNEVRKRPALLIITPLKMTRRLLSFRTLGIVIRKTIKYGLILTISTTLLLVMVIFASSLFISEKFVTENLEKIVQESTGGTLAIKKTQFNIVTGLTLEGLQFYPTKDSGSHVTPLAQIDKINLNWDFLRLLLFKFHIKNAEILNPKFNLTNSNDIWNFQPILDFLAKNTNKKDETLEQKPTEAASDETSSSFLPIHPATILIMPIKVMIDSIGFKNLKADVSFAKSITSADGKTTTESSFIQFSGLSSNISANWFGTKSKFAIEVYSPENENLSLSVQNTSTKKPVNVLTLKSKLKNLVTLEDFDNVSVELNGEINSIVTPEFSLKNLPWDIKLGASLLPSLDGIKIRPSTIQLLDFVKDKISGEFKLTDGKMDAFYISLNNSLDLDLDKANQLASTLKLPLTVGGKFSIRNILIDGPLVPAKISEKLSHGSIPSISVDLAFNNIKATVPSQGLTLLPTSGEIDLSVDTSPTDDGIKIDLDTRIDSNGAELSQELEKKPLSLKIAGLKTTFSGRVSYPNIMIPFVRMGVDIEKITASLGNEKPIIVPFTSEVFASVSDDMKKINVDAKMELEDIVDFSLELSCKMQCNKFKLNQSLQLEDFSKLYAIVLPVLPKFVPLNLIPKHINGKLVMQTNIKGTSKNIQETNIEKILQQTDGKVSYNFNLTKFGIAVPDHDVTLENYNAAIAIGGTLNNQTIEVSQDFDRLALKLTPKKNPKNTAEIKHLSLETKIDNNVDLSKGLKDVINNLVTVLKANLYVGQVSLPKIIPQPINSLSLDFKTKQTRFKKIELHEINFKAPDFGAELALSGNTNLDKNMKPESLKLQTYVAVKNGGGPGLANKIKTSGILEVNAQLETIDLKVFSLAGKAKFLDFDLLLPDADSQKPNILTVEKINGDFPLSQKIDITPYFDIKKLMSGADEGAAKPKVLEKSDLVAATPNGGAPALVVTESPPKDPKVVSSKPDEIKPDAANIAANEELKPQIPKIDAIDKYYDKTNSQTAVSSNLVSHTDFTAVKSFYPEHKTLTIKKISAANLDLTDMEFDIEVKQNWFSLSQFSINFLGGKIQGDMNLAFNPLPDKFNLTVHTTNLNTTKLLANFDKFKNKSKSWDLFSNPYLDMNVHINYDIKNNDLQGGLDITRIGKEQLKMMLFYLDPESSNPSLGFIRTALTFGDISNVTIPIRSGFIGLDVGITFLAVPIPLPKIDRFPVAQLISNFQVNTAPVETEPDDET